MHTGKWEATITVYVGLAPIRLGLYDSAEEAGDSIRVAGVAIERTAAAKINVRKTAPSNTRCSVCEKVASVEGLKGCTLCVKVCCLLSQPPFLLLLLLLYAHQNVAIMYFVNTYAHI